MRLPSRYLDERGGRCADLFANSRHAGGCCVSTRIRSLCRPTSHSCACVLMQISTTCWAVRSRTRSSRWTSGGPCREHWAELAGPRHEVAELTRQQGEAGGGVSPHCALI